MVNPLNPMRAHTGYHPPSLVQCCSPKRHPKRGGVVAARGGCGGGAAANRQVRPSRRLGIMILLYHKNSLCQGVYIRVRLENSNLTLILIP